MTKANRKKAISIIGSLLIVFVVVLLIGLSVKFIASTDDLISNDTTKSTDTAVAKPRLVAPVLSLSGTILTISNLSANETYDGIFIYCDSRLLVQLPAFEDDVFNFQFPEFLLEEGSHIISAKVVGSGYVDSVMSNYVIYTYDGPATISFTVDQISLEAEEWMTWAEWVESDYNTASFSLTEGTVGNVTGSFVGSNGKYITYDGEIVTSKTIIVANRVYSIESVVIS